MILIADSGSTKTEWILLENGETLEACYTDGLNPFFVTPLTITQEIQKSVLHDYSSQIKHVHFYGAGCSSRERNGIIEGGIASVLSSAEIVVETDMLGACRALFGKERGIAVILGTGSNSAQYDGEHIEFTPPSLGYVLGDEGSGNHLVRILIKDFLENRLSDELHTEFQKIFNYDRSVILHKVYKESFPNRFLAQFSRFLYQFRSEPYCQDVVRKGFESFIKSNLSQHQNAGSAVIRFTGSVAYYFQDILKELAQAHHLNFDCFHQSPVAGLKEYHLKHS